MERKRARSLNPRLHKNCMIKELADIRNEMSAIVPWVNRLLNMAMAVRAMGWKHAVDAEKWSFCKAILTLWKLMSKYLLAGKKAKNFKNKIVNRVRNHQKAQLNEAHRLRDHRRAWYLMRQLAYTLKGSRRKWNRTPMISHPSRARTLAIYEADPADGDWCDAIGRDEGKEIGAEAMLKGYSEMVDLYAGLTMTPKKNAPTEAEATEWAQLVYINMIHHVKAEKNMKTVPPWGVPMECWKLLLIDLNRRYKPKFGVGAVRQPVNAPLVRRTLLSYFKIMAITGDLGIQSFSSQGHRIHKTFIQHIHDSKVGLDARVIFSFDAVAKLMIKSILPRTQWPVPLTWEFGCVPRRTSEHVTIIQMCLQDRIRQTPGNVVTALKCYDATNAFNSPDHAAAKIIKKDTAGCIIGRHLMQHRAMLLVQCSDGWICLVQ